MRAALLSELFGGESRALLLSALFLNPSRTFSPSELAKLAGVDGGNASKWLARWAAVGLARRTVDGRNVRYQAGSDPMLTGLGDLFLRGSQILDDILAAVPSEAETVAIFGSTARGEDKAGSDIDVLVIGEGLSDVRSNAALRPVARKHQRVINASVFGTDEFRELLEQGHGFAAEVVQQPHIVLKGALPHASSHTQTTVAR